MNFLSFLKRVIAYYIDLLLITVLTMSAFLVAGFSAEDLFGGGYDIMLSGIIGLLYLLYATFLDASKIQSTIGARFVGLKIVDLNGNRIGNLKSLDRNLLKVISAIPFFCGFLMILSNQKGQAFHDKFSKTLVVNR